MKEEYYEKNKKNYIHTSSIYGGILSQVKIVDKDDEIGENEILIEETGDKKVVARDIRKIVFSKAAFLGTDLFYKLKREQKYKYEIIGMTSLDNNKLVIREHRKFCNLLDFTGFSHCIMPRDLNSIKKILLSKRQMIRIKSYDISLTEKGVVNTDSIPVINEQASSRLEFKRIDLPSRPQTLEKVYAKYFK